MNTNNKKNIVIKIGTTSIIKNDKVDLTLLKNSAEIIVENKNQFDLPNSTAHITKVMTSHPRRISKIIVEINFDSNNLSEQNIEKLIAVAKGCPVAQSLSSDLVQEVRFNF